MNKEEVTALRNKGFTFKKIGRLFNVSRQRAFQVYTQPPLRVYEGTWYSRMRQDPVRLAHYKEMKREASRGRLCVNGRSIKVRKRPRPDNICELCNRHIEGRINYHHWDDSHPEWGVWVCYRCHWLCEWVDDEEDICELRQTYLDFKEFIPKQTLINH